VEAMVFSGAGKPLALTEMAPPRPDETQLLIHVTACAVCRTDLHIFDGELADSKRPLILGHQIVGMVTALGAQVRGFACGDRVGVSWLGSTCGVCTYCRSGRENLCDQARFTGYQIDGGYAEFAVADHRFCFHLRADYNDVEVAPLLCAGVIGYRSLRLAGEGKRLGIYGFGAAGSIVAQVARHQGREIYAFTRPGDLDGAKFARELGAVWAGSSLTAPPEPLDAALIFAPVGSLVTAALHVMAKGGTVVCGGIHMSDIPGFPYVDLWEERSIRSVANLTRQDAAEFLALAPQVPVKTRTLSYPLASANEALDDLRHGRFDGSAVLVPAHVASAPSR
jgi:alcohol dehydrogenase, propanol-preferring